MIMTIKYKENMQMILEKKNHIKFKQLINKISQNSKELLLGLIKS